MHKPADSLTALLKRKGAALSAVAANKKLLAAGVLEVRERPSTARPGVMKPFKALTDLGLEFGENVPNPRAEGETSPMYFVETFDTLYERFLDEPG